MDDIIMFFTHTLPILEGHSIAVLCMKIMGYKRALSRHLEQQQQTIRKPFSRDSCLISKLCKPCWILSLSGKERLLCHGVCMCMFMYV